MKRTVYWRTRVLLFGAAVALLLSLSACKHDNYDHDSSSPDMWNVTATEVPWLQDNPIGDKHDGGWVYSAREDVLYAIYGNSDYEPEAEAARDGGQYYCYTLYRIDYIAETSDAVATFSYNRHGSQPVIDDTGTYIYLPPAEDTSVLERYNTVTEELEELAGAPDVSTYSHGTWKNGKLWITLDSDEGSTLYSYDPDADEWSEPIWDFDGLANEATSGSDSDLIYVIVDGGDLYAYDTEGDTLTQLDSHPFGFYLGGNAEFTWFGEGAGYLYACDGDEGELPAIYDITAGTWAGLADPKTNSNYNGHATYDSLRHRLIVAGSTDDVDDTEVWYYQF